MSQKTKSVLMRFVKGFVAGAVTMMLGVSISAPANWVELMSALSILAVTGIYGGVVGLLLALEKWYSWKETLA